MTASRHQSLRSNELKNGQRAIQTVESSRLAIFTMRDLTQQECNRLLVARYWEEFWSKGNADIVDEACADNFSQFYPMHGRLNGKAEVKLMLATFKKV